MQLFDTIETEHDIGLILEYAAGGHLRDMLNEGLLLSETAARVLFAQLIDGVSYIHANDIVHRDIKLDNLLLDAHGNVLITDFGLAGRVGPDGLMTECCGTPWFTSPEVAIHEGRQPYVGTAADVWSCGVVLYTLLAGHMPFDDDPDNPDGEDVVALYYRILTTPVDVPAHVSECAQELLRGMLDIVPAARLELEDVRRHAWLRAAA